MAGTGPPPMRPGRNYINPNEEDQMEISGYKPHIIKKAIVWFFIIITVGLLRLFFFWLPHVFVKATHSRCSLSEATTVLLTDQWNQWFTSTVMTLNKKAPENTATTDHALHYSSDSKISLRGDDVLRFFICKKVKYVWDFERRVFNRLRGLEVNHTCNFFHKQTEVTINEKEKKQLLYGANTIRIHVTPIVKILFKEVLSPFYVFQVFSVCLWYSDDYYVYASVIVFISLLSIIITIYQTRKMQRALRSTITSSTIVTVCRGQGEYHDMSSEDLVPGDVLEIPRHGCTMQCDAVLISGNCIVNESMLTGESVPITKTPLPNPLQTTDREMFHIQKHARHVLYSGTQVIQTRFYGSHKVTAVVVRTGFQTSKGELVRSILYPKPVDFRFNRDSYWFIGILALIASLGFIYTIVLMVQFGDTAGDIVIRALDLLTIAVPPALPAALGVGIVYAQQRLKDHGIFCISPRGINICGTINTVCFDKTGTLTEDGLNMMCVAPCSNGRFDREVRDMMKLPEEIATAMATCHSLTIIDGKLMGDPLDLIMFESIDWKLEEPGQEETRFDMIVPTVVSPKSTGGYQGKDVEIAVVKQFTFSSSLQRMSVVTRKLGGTNFDLFVKGAPEMIASLSKSETVPPDFHELLMTYTQHGYRVIALAWKPLPSKLNYVKVQRVTREQVENDLIFLGLLVMENCLKPESAPTIQVLREADIRNIMVTGDNMLTALSVARECCMVDPSDRIILVQAYPPHIGKTGPEIEFVHADDREKTFGKNAIDLHLGNHRTFHFAVTGKSWAVIRQYFPDVLHKIVVKGTVFARMGPEQKAQLVESLQLLGYYVGMCGDGANDCGALKAAHTGISLSEAEASVASPFTSKKPTIECVPTVIREGRAALVTSFGIFKYMACYSLTQFVTVLLLYWIGANLTDLEFLYVDLPLVITLSITFGRTHAYPELVRERPPYSLLAIAPILSIIVQMGIQTAFQVYCYFHVMRQPWFVPFIDNEDDDYVSYENAAIFLISSYQYISLAVAFSKGAPFRKTIFSNYWFLLNLVLCGALCVWVSVYPTQGFAEFLELKPFPSVAYGAVYVGLAAMNFMLSVMVETFIMDNSYVREKCYSITKGCLPSNQYQHTSVQKEIDSNPSWPPVSSKTVNLAEAFQRLDSAHHVPKDVSSTPGKDILDEIIESDGESHSQKSLGQVNPGFMDDINGTHNILDAQEQTSDNPEGRPGETSIDENGKFMTTL